MKIKYNKKIEYFSANNNFVYDDHIRNGIESSLIDIQIPGSTIDKVTIYSYAFDYKLRLRKTVFPHHFQNYISLL
jgi:hypothetical protein